ncbi:MAG: N-acetylglucosamine-6-phosphate deacetylase [Lachnospiraceae bacterium]|nr:N-acetylglucosamine-6-phosphate deacetylase [Lachnospiraceae bacterium]
MVIHNVNLYTEKNGFQEGMVVIEKDRITNVFLQDTLDYDLQKKRYIKDGEQQCLNGERAYLIPGMIDIHLHGCNGYDFCDGTLEAVEKITEYQANIGVTTIAPATMTLPIKRLGEILKQGAVFHEKKACGEYDNHADLAGINMEGPFISKEKKGAQKEDDIRKPEVTLFRQFQQSAEGLIKYIGIAPEEEGALEFIREIKDEVKVTLAHSNADYGTAKTAFEAGACHVTHLYNGMTAYSHREPGIVGAVYDCKDIEVELICDGIHVHPTVIRATFAMLGKDKIIVISDSIRATGMSMGDYELGGQQVTIRKDRAVISGTEIIAGSIVSLPEALRYIVQVAGISLEDAIMCMTQNPAKSLGIYEECGSISVGKRADLVLLDENLMVKSVIKRGKLIK